MAILNISYTCSERTTESMFFQINTYWKVWEVGKCASWFSSYLIKQEASTKNEDAPHAFNFASNAEDKEAHTLFLSLLENQFLDSLKGLVLYSLRCKFFTLLVEIDTATILMGDCLKYVNDLGEDLDGLDDAML